jgi:hypothetical protein
LTSESRDLHEDYFSEPTNYASRFPKNQRSGETQSATYDSSVPESTTDSPKNKDKPLQTDTLEQPPRKKVINSFNCLTKDFFLP